MVAREIAGYVLAVFLSWLAAMILGSGLGALLALVLRAIFKAVPALHKLSILLPWRTVLAGLLLVAWSWYPVVLFRAGPGGAGFLRVIAGFGIVVLTMIVAGRLLLSHWLASPLSVRLIGLSRDMAVTALTALNIAGAITGWGLGYVARLEFSMVFEMAAVWRGLMIFVGIAVAFDLLLGVIQTIAAFSAGRSAQTSDTAAQGSASA